MGQDRLKLQRATKVGPNYRWTGQDLVNLVVYELLLINVYI